jgi:dienelactone hydrolase
VEDLLARVNCPVLGIFGEADHIISVEDVTRFRNALEKAKKDYHIRIYRDAPHGWLNDTMPRTLPQRAGQRRMESDDVIREKMLHEWLGSRPSFMEF